MNKIYLIASILFINMVFAKDNDRLVTVGGSVTETVFKLGAGDLVVAVDQSSIIPQKVKDLPQVGYIRAISSEGILSMNPTKILTTNEIGPQKVINKIVDSGTNIKIFDSPKTFDEILNLVTEVSLFLGLDDRGIVIKNNLLELDAKVKEQNKKILHKPKIIFFMNPSKNAYTAAGANTRADYLIDYIGGMNVFSGDFNRYNNVTKENIINYNPDIILVGYINNDNKKEVVDLFMNSNKFNSINAVSNNKVFDVSVGEILNFGPSFVSSSFKLINRINDQK